MTSKDNLPEVTILCEDIDHERFITQYLICCGFNKRKIKNFDNPQARKIDNNNDFVLKHYPELVRDYRKRKYRNIAVVVMIDGDDKTVSERIRSLNKALDERAGELNKDSRKTGEKIAIFVPTINIETWFYYINGNENCDEETDYKNKKLSEKERIKLAKDCATKLANEMCPQGLPPDAPPSLLNACQELERLQLD